MGLPAPELERDHRLGRAPLLDNEQGDGDDRDQRDDRGLGPARGRERREVGHDRGDRDGEHAGAQVIDLVPAPEISSHADRPRSRPTASSPIGRFIQKIHAHDQRWMMRRADQRADDRRERPDAGEPALNLAALMHRIEIADDRHRDRLHGAGADALDEPEDDERGHRPGKAAEDRADEEDRNARQHDDLAAPEVGKLAEDDSRRGLGQEEGGEDPAIEFQPAELGDDLRHCGRDDRRLDGDHEIRRHHGGEHKRAMRGEGGHGRLHRGEGAPAPITLSRWTDDCRPDTRHVPGPQILR